ncbi:hypothetical protein CDAR_474391 [Caerostris darwini]|uniref:Uncharacterized protein n=1 Tax=Caerostris darwini TaxID=1538125 RepID=A0AAV4M539_9ARAC|nr:hypothetical protein CDAR_474391 [Caerostris darwini]
MIRNHYENGNAITSESGILSCRANLAAFFDWELHSDIDEEAGVINPRVDRDVFAIPATYLHPPHPYTPLSECGRSTREIKQKSFVFPFYSFRRVVL